jgi:2-desacetyl-2-hydroxyethyl bacteriochlorophyllide A dehydrogenase
LKKSIPGFFNGLIYVAVHDLILRPCRIVYPKGGTMKAQAIVATGINQVELKQVDLPEPGEGEVLMEAQYSCISPGTETRCLSGKQGDAKFPFVPGYAAVGRVAKAGKGVSLAQGTVAFYMGSAYTGAFNSAWAAHMSHVVCGADRLLPIPAGVDLIQASAGKMASIPYHGLRLCAPLPEEKIAIIGLGAIGHMAAKLYTASGANTVACDMSAKRVAQAKAAGINASLVSGSLQDTFKPFFPEGADAIVDCTGVPAVLPNAINVAREFPWGNHQMRGPRYILQGSYPDSFSIPYNAGFLREMVFIMPRSEQDRDRVIIFDMLKRGALSITSVISDLRKPQDAQKTYAQLLEKDTDLMTVVFQWK